MNGSVAAGQLLGNVIGDQFRVPFSFAIKLPVQLSDGSAATIGDPNQVPNRGTTEMGAMTDVPTASLKFRIKTKLIQH